MLATPNAFCSCYLGVSRELNCGVRRCADAAVKYNAVRQLDIPSETSV